MIIEKNILENNIKENIKIERFDMAINFYSVVKINGSPNLVCYDFKSVWNSWFPFYDDVNKTPVIKPSEAKTYDDLIRECDKYIDINIDEKIKLAKDRFKELIGNSDFVISKLTHHVLYEIKYSKSANLYTLYKLYNFVITSIDDKNILLNPKKLKCKTFNLNNFNNDNLVSNALYIVEHENLKQFSL